MTCCAPVRVEVGRQPITRMSWRCFVWCTAAKELHSLLWTIPRKSTVCDHKSTLPPDLRYWPCLMLRLASLWLEEQHAEKAQYVFHPLLYGPTTGCSGPRISRAACCHQHVLQQLRAACNCMPVVLGSRETGVAVAAPMAAARKRCQGWTADPHVQSCKMLYRNLQDTVMIQ